MKLTLQDVDQVAVLSRLQLEGPAREEMAAQLGRILAYMDKLNELDVEGVAPMSHPGDLDNVFREDETAASLDRDLALSNAPDKARGCFRVPRILD